jgi:ribosomal protein L30E
MAKMVLVADNGPYHDKQQIGSLASLTKVKLLNMMESHGCDHGNVPVSDLQYNALDLGDVIGVTDMRGYLQVEFQNEDFKQ